MDIFMTGLTLPFFFLFSKSYFFSEENLGFLFSIEMLGKKNFKAPISNDLKTSSTFAS